MNNVFVPYNIVCISQLIPDDLTPELCPEKRLKLSEEDGGTYVL